MGLAKPAWPVLQSGHPLARGLVAAYPFHEGSGGSLSDLSGNSNNLSTAAGTPAWGGSPFGSALSFSGTTDFTKTSAVSLPTTAAAAWTFGGWFNASSFQSLSAVFGFGPADASTGTERYLLEFNSHYYWWGGTNDWDTGVAFDTGGWHHALFTTAGGSTTPTIQFYRDGVLAATGTPSGALAAATSTVGVGVKHPSGTLLYQGLIADFFIANRQFSAADVKQLYVDSFAIYRKPSRWWEVLVAGGATSFSFPTAAWRWNGQAPGLAFTNAAAQKTWVWRPQAPTQGFAVAATQKAWRWNAQAPNLNLISTISQKAWAWAGNAPSLAASIKLAQRAWRWIASGPIIPGLITTTLIRYLGPVWRRRRSRPEL